MNWITLAGIGVTLAGAGISYAGDMLNDKKMKEAVKEEVQKELDERFKNEEEEA